MNKKTKAINPIIYNVSHQDLLDLWVDSFHPDDHLLVIWDALNHFELLDNCGFRLDYEVLYNNKILTVSLDDVMECFYIMDAISSRENHPFVQVYSEGRLLTDNLENLRTDIN